MTPILFRGAGDVIPVTGNMIVHTLNSFSINCRNEGLGFFSHSQAISLQPKISPTRFVTKFFLLPMHPGMELLSHAIFSRTNVANAMCALSRTLSQGSFFRERTCLLHESESPPDRETSASRSLSIEVRCPGDR